MILFKIIAYPPAFLINLLVYAYHKLTNRGRTITRKLKKQQRKVNNYFLYLLVAFYTAIYFLL